MVGRRSERFLTTVLFTDIVGSTELAAELGDRGWRDLVQQHHGIVRAALRRYGGREIDTAGDSFFAVFDAPAAAIDCALGVATSVHGLGLQVRGGIHVGEVEQIAGKVGGITVPIASRIMASAVGDEVLVSATVRDLAAGSGLQFQDRGVRELKGVPGEWRLFAVSRVSETTDVDGSAGTHVDGATRRAAAVRRSQARPLWRRHPRLAAGVVLGLGAVIAAGGLVAWSPWRLRAIPSVAENSVGIIDPGRNEIVRQTAVGAQPAAITVGPEGVWVTNTGSDTVSRIDPATHAVVDTIDVGKDPEAVAVGAGSIWVADSGERAVTRINAATGRVVDTIEVGNGPRGLAFAANAVWVSNWADGTIIRLDPITGQPGPPINVTSVPTAVAGDDAGIWVVSEDGGTVTQLDPATGIALAAPIPVGLRPAALAIGDGAVWVANSGDGSVSCIDQASHRVNAVLDVGGAPVGLALSGRTLWVADREGAVRRVELGTPSAVPIAIRTSSAAESVAIVNGEVWFASRASAASHRGGTLRVVSFEAPGLDPTTGGYYEFEKLLGDGLVSFRRTGGIAGSQLVPDLATSLPRVSDGGRTYTFLLRPNVQYADGTPVRAADVRYAIERSFQVEDPVIGGTSSGYFGAIKGSEACADPPVPRCDLSAGIAVDDRANAITFHLSKPDPDFLYKLSLPSAFAVPASVPPTSVAERGWPGPGPYSIASVGANELHLTRNPHFRSWDRLVRPDGYVDAIVWTWGVTADEQVAQVRAGTADYMADQIPADAFATLRTQYTSQLHGALQATTYLFLNTAKPPFDKLDARRALAFAIDRSRVVALRGGRGPSPQRARSCRPIFRVSSRTVRTRRIPAQPGGGPRPTWTQPNGS